MSVVCGVSCYNLRVSKVLEDGLRGASVPLALSELMNRPVGAGLEAYVLIVSGRVQGVGFRWFTEREALKRDVRGYVRNLADGRVEVLAQGEREPLLQFCERVRRGPPASRVEDVHMEAVALDDSLATFQVRF